MRQFWTVCAAILMIALTNGALTSCGNLAQVPPDAAVQLAVTQQLTHVQNEIAKAWGLPIAESPNFKIDKLTVSRREKLNEPAFQAEGYPSDIYRVSGTIETTLTSESGKTQQAGPFEVILGTTPSTEAAGAPSETPPDLETWYLIPPPQA